MENGCIPCSSVHLLIKWSLFPFPRGASDSTFHLWSGRGSTINFLGFAQLPLDLPCVDTRGRKIPPGAWLSLSSSSLNPVGPFRAWKGLQHCCELLQRLPGTPVLPWVMKPHHPTNGLSSTPLLGLLYFLLFEQNLWDWISKLTQSEVEDTYRTVLQIKGGFFHRISPIPPAAFGTRCQGIAPLRSDLVWSQKELSKLSLPFPTKSKTLPTRKAHVTAEL